MKISIEAPPKEIAALVLAVQERRAEEKYSPVEIIKKSVQQAIDGIAEDKTSLTQQQSE